jgi:hypothetical protein
MSADLDFLEELLLGLDTPVLEWAQIRIRHILEGRQPEIVKSRIIIRKED